MTPEQQKALQELAEKTLPQIQIETAYTWAYRSWAARSIAQAAKNTGDWEKCLTARHDATEYEHEAIEHAALSGSDGILAAVRAIIATGKPSA